MKKSIAILSMVLLAGNAFAADVLEVGTNEAPKYYVIKANRGLPWVTYTPEKLDNGGAETTLYRAEELSEAAVWAVVPGTEEGTVNIYNYITKDSDEKAYIFSFITRDGSEFVGAYDSGTATTDGAQDIYVKDNGNGSYGLSLQNETGVLDHGVWALDAIKGTSQFLGNWFNIGDEGTQWWFYDVDIENIEASLDSIEYKVLESNMKAMVEQYSTLMANYSEAVPWVAAELNAGIDALSKLDVSFDYEDQIKSIWNEYIDKANTKLNAMFNGKEIAFLNLRRVAYGKQNPYLAVGETTYPMAETLGDPEAVFVLESTTYVNEVEATEELASYYLYNPATQTYLGADNTPVNSKEEAVSIRFVLNNNGRFIGINIFVNGISDRNALNVDTYNNPLTYYTANDDGSIWSIFDVDEEGLHDYIVSCISSLIAKKIQPYVANVPSVVANVLNAGIDEITALPYSNDIIEKGDEIVANTIKTANDLLTTGMNGMKLNIFYPRGNTYLSFDPVAEDWASVDENSSANEVFTIKSVEGGVVLYNVINDIYIGKGVEEYGEITVLPTTEESDAQIFTIELNNFRYYTGDYYGVSFVFTDENGSERALNMNNYAPYLHTYDKANVNSIFYISESTLWQRSFSLEIVGNGKVYSNTLNPLVNGTTFQGSNFEFFIVPNDGNIISSITLDGQDIMSSLTNQILTISDYKGYVESDGILKIEFAPEADATLVVKGADNHAIRHTYKEGTKAVVELQPEEGWKIHSVTYNGEDVTDRLENNVFMTEPLHGENNLNMVLVSNSTVDIEAISAADGQVRISVNRNTVSIIGLDEDEPVSVYDVSGKTIYTGFDRSVTLKSGEAYILTTPSKTFKVAI